MRSPTAPPVCFSDAPRECSRHGCNLDGVRISQPTVREVRFVRFEPTIGMTSTCVPNGVIPVQIRLEQLATDR
jgi:hypothetical protein